MIGPYKSPTPLTELIKLELNAMTLADQNEEINGFPALTVMVAFAVTPGILGEEKT